MTQNAFTTGFEHLPTEADLDRMRADAFETAQTAIDDFYTAWVLQDYTPGDEKTGMFFEEGFALAVEGYEIEANVDLSQEDRERIRAHIQESWAQVQEHGFDEPLLDEITNNKALIDNDPRKVEGER